MFEAMNESSLDVLATIESSAADYFRKAIPEGGYYGLLLTNDDLVVAGGGVLIADWPGALPAFFGKRCWIMNMYVEPEHRRRGHARCILRGLIDWCRSQGFDAVNLHASPAGRPLYEEAGFKPTREMRLNL